MENKLIKKNNLLDSKAVIMMSNKNGVSNIINEDVCLPVVVIKEAALNNNINWMQTYARMCNVYLAPHGKTTMTPAIFKKQIDAGAWGIGVGTAYQAKIAIDSGVKNIIIANQLIGQANMLFISNLKQQDNINIFCCVDSKENALQLSEHFTKHKQTMNVLLELGVDGGRCGCRTKESAIELAKYIDSLSGLVLSGIEFYEGVIHGANEQEDIVKINTFLQRVIDTTHQLVSSNLFCHCDEIIFTGAGSVWYDIVCQKMQQTQLPHNFRYVIRPGCYVTHDKGVYEQAHEVLKKRSVLACKIDDDLISALELFAFVQSLPEANLAIIGFGKRDVAFDEGLPQPIAHYRNGKQLLSSIDKMKTEKIMDQHAMLGYTDEVDLKVGDILVFGTSHPCITFDKWRQLYLVDEEYNITETIMTYF